MGGSFQRNTARTANAILPFQPDRPVKGKLWGACEGASAVHSPPLFLGLHLSLACLRSSALTPSALRPPAKAKAVRQSGADYVQISPDDRSRACKCGWAGRGNALYEGEEWCHRGCTTRTALLHSVGLLGRGTAEGRREIHCKAAVWRRPPPFLGHFRAHGGLHSCAA